MKYCPDCKQEKEDSDFYKDTHGRLRSYCKKCWVSRSQVYTANTGWKTTKIRIKSEECKEKERKIAQKYRDCIKKLCPISDEYKIVELICPVCKTTFGKRIANIKSDASYCSPRCQHISMTKKWQQTKSPYAQNIQRIKKELGEV